MKDSLYQSGVWKTGGRPLIDERSDLLPLCFHSIGHFPSQKHIFRPNGYILYQISVCIGGKGVFSACGREYEIGQGDVFFFSPGVPHGYYPVGGDWDIVWVVFYGKEVDNILGYLSLDEVFVREVSDEAAFRKVTDICEYLYQSCRGGDDYLRMVKLMELFKCLSEAQKISGRDDKTAEGRFAPAIEFIRNNYKEDISLEDIAKTVEMSRSHFCRMFKGEYGITPMNYLINYRVSAAKYLLETTEETLGAIMKRTGFHNVSYFCTAFRNCEGMSPIEYRKKHRK